MSTAKRLLSEFYHVTAIILSALLLFPITSYASDTSRYKDTIFFLEEVYMPPESDKNMIREASEKTPDDVMELFKHEDVRVYISRQRSRNLPFEAGGYFNGDCKQANYTCDKANKITKVSNPVSITIYSLKHDKDAYIHECGHALDKLAEYVTGTYAGKEPLSSSDEWDKLYTKYSSTLSAFDTASKATVPVNKTEGFAEAYRIYVRYSKQLKDRCPEVYEYVDSQITALTDSIK